MGDVLRGRSQRKPRLLDLFCGAGGAGKGYADAGFDVVGVDIAPQPRYPFEFHQADAMTDPLDGFDAIHASPPCQRFAVAGTTRALGEAHPDLLTPTRARLQAWGGPYVVENVPNAPMPNAVLLCGSTFGLPVVRHRLFEIEPPTLVPSLCHQKHFARSVDHGAGFYPYARGTWEPAWRRWPLLAAGDRCRFGSAHTSRGPPPRR